MTVAVVGDLVGSREVPDQRRLLEGLTARIECLRQARSAGPTVGDEFQAVFDDLPVAIDAIARLRLDLALDPPADHPVEIRVGFGTGDIIATSGTAAGAPGQSGSAWWAAREALDRVAVDRRAWPTLRWWVAGQGDHAAVRAALIGLDTVLARFDLTDLALARGLVEGRSGTDLAEEIGVTRQSVSARLRDHGVYGWVRALQALTGEGT